MTPLRILLYSAIIGFSFGTIDVARAEGLMDSALRVLGVSATPSQLKGIAETVTGQIWIVDLAHGIPSPLSAESAFRWPVFTSDGNAIIALQDNNLIRLSAPEKKPEVLYSAAGIKKLVGFDREEPDRLLVVLDDSRAPLGFISLKSGKRTFLHYDPNLPQQRRMLSHIEGEERIYDTGRVYIKTESKPSLEGTLEWTDVYFQQGNSTSRNVSKCDGVNCAQPSLSPTGQSVVYIRSK